MHQGAWLFVLASLGFGFASAFIPFVDAETYVVAGSAVAATDSFIFAVVAVGIGQSTGKWVVYELARHGSQRAGRRPKKVRTKEPGPLRTWLADMSVKLLNQLDRPVVGPAVVLSSSLLGLPPLAIVAILAGIRRMPRVPYVLAVLVGRLARFTLLALPILLARR